MNLFKCIIGHSRECAKICFFNSANLDIGLSNVLYVGTDIGLINVDVGVFTSSNVGLDIGLDSGMDIG